MPTLDSLSTRLAHSEKFWKALFWFNALPPPSASSLASRSSILVIRPDEIGDVILTSPLLRELRANAPRAWITLVVKRACLPLVEHCPHINEAVVYDWESVDPRAERPWPLRRAALSLAIRRLRRRRFDLCLLPRRDPDTYGARFLALFAGAREVAAMVEDLATPALERRFPSRILTHTFFESTVCHEVEHNLQFLRLLGGEVGSDQLEFWLAPDDHAFAASALPAGRQFVAFAPGARAVARCWPVDKFAALAQVLQRDHGLTPVVLGAPEDPSVPGALSLSGRTTLRQAAAVLQQCRLYVGNDTGLKHLAAAVGTPVVELSAFRAGGNPIHCNSPARFHAWTVPQRVLQPPPGPGTLAIAEIETEAALAACRDLLSIPPSGTSAHARSDAHA